MKSDRVKGYFFAIVATLAFSNIYIFSKAALNEVHLYQFGVYWFAVSLLFNLGWLVKTGGLTAIRNFNFSHWRILLLLGILEILTNLTFYLSIQIIPDPAVTSFLGNIYPVLLTIMGVIFLSERFSLTEGIGALLALTGAFVISYQGGTSLSDLFIPGAGVVLINAIFAAVASLIVKMNLKKIPAEVLNTNVSAWLFLASAVMLLISGKPLAIPVSALTNIVIGSFFGPFLGILTIYYSFKYIEVSKSSIVQSLKGVFVLAGSYLYFQTFPLGHQLWGGLLTVLGVLLISLAKMRIFRRRSFQGE
ncbi:DMT family transporter [Gaoshiqia sp. Z1-71]|uniref:DMT family transporter n=1 Tax=Gaoshiqia hydrogeniformans TaxID=3290090 RepID=UPI003BF845A1